MQGNVHSIQTLGTLDGPGVRVVVFFQGCPLRCACCHNPDTWEYGGGESMTVEAVLAQIRRCRPYFGARGGVTLSGGEPLAQAAFAEELLRACRAEGIHTCLDTSGCLFNADVERVLAQTELVLLDVKYTAEAEYAQYVGGCTLAQVLRFLAALETREIPVWLRQVTIPGINDTQENLEALARISRSHRCVKKTELLAFRTLCHTKYEALGIPFRFSSVPEPTPLRMEELRARLGALCAAGNI